MQTLREQGLCAKHTRLPCAGAMLQAFHKLQSKAKTIPELKSTLQQICDDLPQTTIN